MKIILIAVVVFALNGCYVFYEPRSKKLSDEQCRNVIQNAWDFSKKNPNVKCVLYDKKADECFEREHLIKELREKDSISDTQ